MLAFAFQGRFLPVPVRDISARHKCSRMCSDPPSRPAFRSEEDRAKDFLTQRALQQTMFCSRVLRDETTVRWLEDWLGHNGLDDLHHCDALKVGSTEYLTRLFKEPPVVLEIKKPIPGRTTSNNPYIKRRYFTYDVEIVPRKLGLRILEARKQIAEEMAEDIPCILYENQRLVELYRSRVVSNDLAPLANFIFNLSPTTELRGSPYRIANYDLAKNYTLYLGVCAAIQELSGKSQTQADADWLTLFLSKHGKDLISPYAGEHGNANAVIEIMLMTPPSIREGSGGFFDPASLAEKVLQLRERIATSWTKVMKDAENDQLNLKRRLLEDDM